MRPTISGLVAAIAVMTVAAAPAMACGGYGPCAQSYVPTPVYSGCYSGCSWRERLPDPQQWLSGAPPCAAVLLLSIRARPIPVRVTGALSGLSGAVSGLMPIDIAGITVIASRLRRYY
jgi:hypothetical protein